MSKISNNPFASKPVKKPMAKKKVMKSRTKVPKAVIPEQADLPKPLWEPSWTGASFSAERFKHWVVGSDNRCLPSSQDEFTDNINWRILRIMAEFVEGFEFLSKFNNEVTVFGGVRLSSKHPYYQIARKLGRLCGKAGYTMVTGGGPGMMEAANRGAYEVGGRSIGLTIQLPMEQRSNQYIQQAKDFRYFFTRKVMLSASAQAYVFMPGGFGTMDELFEMVTLIQTGKMSDQIPVILIGKEFWTPLLKWIKKAMLEDNQTIGKEDLKIFQLVETAEEAFAIIQKTSDRKL
jgi:uncharacterized protein (TIGR00730 family)